MLRSPSSSLSHRDADNGIRRRAVPEVAIPLPLTVGQRAHSRDQRTRCVELRDAFQQDHRFFVHLKLDHEPLFDNRVKIAILPIESRLANVLLRAAG